MKKIKLLLLIICFNNVTNYSFAQCSSKIKCGAYHSSILKTDGTIWAFGFGGLGNLGNGNDSNSLSQISLGIGTSWIQIENGTYNSFSIKNDGTLWGTGYNLYGQLGINATTEYLSTLTQIGTAINWKEVVSSDGFTIGLKTNNTLWGWGQNNNYQMGDGTCCANRLAPGQIGTATDWKEIAVSQVNSAFAIKNNGTLWCWGSNIAGLIGSNLQPSVPFPIQHNTDTDWASITLGNAHMLALKTNGTLWSWGSGGQGQTANDGTFGYYEPHQIGTSTWKMVVGGSNTSFGIKTDGTLWAWGQNDAGQLGIGGITANKFAPVQIGTDTNWDKVAAGYEHAVALKTDGSLWAWGDNTYGQLGNGTTTSSLVPIQIPVAGCTLGVDGFDKSSIDVYPNPTHGLVYITDNNGKFDTVTVYTTLGQEVLKPFVCAQGETVDLRSLPVGVYLLEFKGENSTLVKKVVKK